MTQLLREIRISLRRLARRPAYAITAILTVILGVGSATVAFGLLHQVVLRPLSFAEPDELVTVRSRYADQRLGLTSAEFRAVRDAGLFDSVGAVVEPYLDGRQVWTGRETPELLRAARATPELFRTLGVSPARGPGFTGGAKKLPEVVLAHAFWRDRFGAAPDVVGRSMEINGTPHTVVGVLPRSFSFPIEPEPFDVWIAFHPPAAPARAGDSRNLRFVGRPPPDRPLRDIRAATLRTLTEIRARVAPSSDLEGFSFGPLADDLLGSVRRPLLFLFGGAAIVLLVAAVNLALLIAARNLERDREIRIRAALGAGRWRLLRLLVLEAGVVAIVGGAAAVLLATFGLDAILGAGPGGLVRTDGPRSGLAVALFGVGAALVPALLAAGVPAARVSRSIRHDRSRGASSSRSRRRATAALTAVEACLVFVLLVGSALSIRSLHEVLEVDPGFDAEATVALQIRVPGGRYDTRSAFTRLLGRLEEGVEAVPGVRAAGTVTNLPLDGSSWSSGFAVEGRSLPDDRDRVNWEVVSPGYFDAAGIPVIAGRAFGPEDGPDAPPVAVISKTLAERWWPDSSPLGARVSGYGPEGPWQTVVGIVGDVKQKGLDRDSRGFLYVPASQINPWPERELVVRGAGSDPGGLMPAVRGAIREVEPRMVLGRVRTLDTVVAESSGSYRLRAVLLGAFAALALLLGMGGIYGVAAHTVRSTRREIGIRMAVGADGTDLARRTLVSGVAPVASGIAAGAAVVVILGGALGDLLYGVSPTDPLILAAIALFLLAAGSGAVLPTALHARTTDPARLLREE